MIRTKWLLFGVYIALAVTQPSKADWVTRLIAPDLVMHHCAGPSRPPTMQIQRAPDGVQHKETAPAGIKGTVGGK